MTITLNLLSGPWLPAVDNSGAARKVSIKEALSGGQELRDLDGLAPTEAVAVLRLLVAVAADLHRWESTDEWGEQWRQGAFDPGLVASYVAENAKYFELFDEKQPFYQTAGLQTATEAGIKPVSLLMPEVASGNNTPLFSSLIEDQVAPLTPAQAAVRLIALQGYDTAAIKTGAVGDPAVKAGKTTGNPTGRLGALGLVMSVGRNLFETIMLNYPLGPIAGGDRPSWTRANGPAWRVRPAAGILDLLTWQSRRVRLIPNSDGLVDRVIITAGDRLDHTPLFEPHTLWGQSKTGPVSTVPRRHQPGRSTWAGLTSLLNLEPSSERTSTSRCLVQLGDLESDGHLDPAYPLDVVSVGVVYGNMMAVVEDAFTDRIPLPARALMSDQGEETRRALFEVAASADEVVGALNALHGNLRRASGGDPIPWDGAQRPGETFTAAIGGATRLLLRAVQAGQSAPDPYLQWEERARKAALSIAVPMMENVPQEAFLGVEGERPINQAKAALYFYAALNKALPRAAQQVNKETQ